MRTALSVLDGLEREAARLDQSAADLSPGATVVPMMLRSEACQIRRRWNRLARAIASGSPKDALEAAVAPTKVSMRRELAAAFGVAFRLLGREGSTDFDRLPPFFREHMARVVAMAVFHWSPSGDPDLEAVRSAAARSAGELVFRNMLARAFAGFEVLLAVDGPRRVGTQGAVLGADGPWRVGVRCAAELLGCAESTITKALGSGYLDELEAALRAREAAPRVSPEALQRGASYDERPAECGSRDASKRGE
jgi:hypothetical protein